MQKSSVLFPFYSLSQITILFIEPGFTMQIYQSAKHEMQGKIYCSWLISTTWKVSKYRPEKTLFLHSFHAVIVIFGMVK